jgi:tRNA (cytidine/uridine-2'-O-)-methyltransferase
VRLALFQPDIAPNLGAAIRLTACLGIGLDIIEPCGFPISDKALQRSAMDYRSRCELIRHVDFAAFLTATRATNSRIVLIETSGTTCFTDFAFDRDDILILGRETLGTPADVMEACDETIVIPMAPGNRSLNVTMAGAIVLTEALRQTGGWDGLQS